MTIQTFGPRAVRDHLPFEICVPIIRDAMIALSRGQTSQLPRHILRLPAGGLGLMAGAMAMPGPFGTKVIAVYPGNFAHGLPAHQGAILLFEPDHGALVGIVHAGEVTRIRTAAASAAATHALARADARTLAVLGYGEQAKAHVMAIRTVRPISRVLVWGRDADRRARFAETVNAMGVACVPVETPALAAAEADILCTTTSATEPLLFGVDVRPGTHVNVVGSSHAGPVEIDGDLVARARFIADCRDNVLQQGAEFLRAREAGLVSDTHVVGEIGQVYDGQIAGRTSADEITIYKSLGHIVQDLAAAWYVHRTAGASATLLTDWS